MLPRLLKMAEGNKTTKKEKKMAEETTKRGKKMAEKFWDETNSTLH